MVELSETFVLECEELDKDHQRLVDMVNEITDGIDNGNFENCKSKVLDFVNFTKAHFRREEKLLAKMDYPDVSDHCQHHRQLDEKMEHILEFAETAGSNEMACESLKKELVYFVMDDVITTDMDFKAFIRNNQG